MTSLMSNRLKSIGTYAFAEVDKKVAELKERGIQPIDFGVGDPTIPTPEIVREATKKAIDKLKSSGYPSYTGSLKFRETISRWVHRRFNVDVNPETEVSSTIGSKEAVFNFHEAVVNPGDYVICPSPGYPPYTRRTLFAEGIPFQVPLLAQNNFLIDFDDIPCKIAEKAKILWLNYPNSPSGAIATADYYKRALDFARKYNIIIASDEAYSEIYYTEQPPISILNISREGVIVFNSLSKRSAMTCYRIGWVMGDSRIVGAFRKVKTNIDSGTPTFIQEGAIAALSDEKHVEKSRAEYRKKRDILCDALVSIGLPDSRPDATLYIWQKIPENMTSVDFATMLLQEDVALVTTPGSWISDITYNEINPGEGYIRFALVPSVEDTKLAAEKLKNIRF
ncbi:MAG: LL-diaminopimelate aminotransferase [Spirochaetes bacterium]|nr:MAG: LL-diaminopimelate aminotransferase [Spirochaetota bacterium]